MTAKFDFHQAFKRNIGWMTSNELEGLRRRRVAVAGMGGGGGVYTTTLARLGIGALSVSDFDRFEMANFNRQAGARMSTVGRPKVEVVAEMARDINPEMDLRIFPEGVGRDNVDAFLDGVDFFVDALDVKALDARRLVHARCRDRGIPAVFALPAGMGFVMATFTPESMSLEEFCAFDDAPAGLELVHFFAGFLPDPALFMRYVVVPSAFDPGTGEGPSLGLGLEFCAGAVVAQVAKTLLGRGVIDPAPFYYEFDAFSFTLRRGHLPKGLRDPGMRARLKQDYERYAHLRKA